jgi:hypothetical protein
VNKTGTAIRAEERLDIIAIVHGTAVPEAKILELGETDIGR